VAGGGQRAALGPGANAGVTLNVQRQDGPAALDVSAVLLDEGQQEDGVVEFLTDGADVELLERRVGVREVKSHDGSPSLGVGKGSGNGGTARGPSPAHLARRAARGYTGPAGGASRGHHSTEPRVSPGLSAPNRRSGEGTSSGR